MSVKSDAARAAWEATQRRLWGRRPQDWARLAEPQNRGLITAALDGARVQAGTALLDVGCGSGLALELAAGRNATVAGIDIASSLLEIAEARVPAADLREGVLDALPFPDGAFDAVIAVNALQFAFDPAGALIEVARVLRPGGQLAIGQFSAPERCESTALHLALEELTPPDRREHQAPYALSVPGALERALGDAGLVVVDDRELAGDWRYADEDAALRGLMCSGGGTRAIDLVGEPAVRAALVAGLRRFRDDDGAFVMHNHYRLVVARRG